MALIRHLPAILLFSYFLAHGYFYYRDTLRGRQKSGPRPWEENPAWSAGRILSIRPQRFWFHWYGAIVLSFFSTIALLALLDGIAKPSSMIFAFLLVIAGAMFLAVMIYRTLQWLKFGKLVLIMDPFPGRICGTVGGTIELPRLIDKRGSFSVTLQCITLTRAQRSGHIQKHVFWQETKQTYSIQGARSERLTFLFENIPHHLPESTVYTSQFGYDWVINLRADLPGVDLNRNFIIPVYELDREFRHR